MKVIKSLLAVIGCVCVLFLSTVIDLKAQSPTKKNHIDSLFNMRSNASLIQAAIYLEKADSFELAGEPLKSLEISRKAYQIGDSLNNMHLRVRALRAMAHININIIMDYTEGQKQCSEGIMWAVELNDTSSLVVFTMFMAQIQTSYENYEEALKLYLDMTERFPDNELIVSGDLYPYIADTYLSMKDTLNAVKNLEKVFMINGVVEAESLSAYGWFAKAMYHTLKHQYRESNLSLDMAEQAYRIHKDYRWISYLHYYRAMNFINMKRYNLALETAHKGIKIAKESGYHKEEMDNSYAIYKVYKAREDWEKAEFWIGKYYEMKDQYYTIKKNATIAALMEKNERLLESNKIHELLIEKQKSDFALDRKNTIIVLFSVIIILGSVIIIALIAMYIRRGKNNRQMQLLSSIVRNADNFVIIVDGKGRLIWANTAFYSTYAYSRDELKNVLFNDILVVHESSKETVAKVRSKVLREGVAMMAEIQCYKKTMEPVWVKFTVTPEFDGNGALYRMIIIGNDISVRKENEHQLMKAKKLYEDLVQNATDVIFKMEMDGKLKFMNNAGLELLGYKAEEIHQLHFLDIFHPESSELLDEMNNSPLSGLVRKFEFRLYTSKGKEVWTWGSVRPEYEDGKLVGFQGLCADITDRKHAEAELIKVGRRFREMFDGSSDMIHVVDEKGRFSYVNEAWKKRLGYTDEELKGLVIDKILHPDYQLKTAVRFGSEMTSRRLANGSEYFETCFVSKSGEKIQVLGSNVKYLSKKEGMTLTGIFHDVTAQKHVENQLRSALEEEAKLSMLKSKFISNASHEFRTPLTVIQSNVELMESLNSSGNGQHETFKRINRRIQEEVLRITHILDDLLVLGKEGGRSVVTERVDLQQLVELTSKSAIQLSNSKRTIKISTFGTPKTVQTDRFLMERILINLISNAVKYSENSLYAPEVIVMYGQNEVYVGILDYGIGIPVHNQVNLFQPFYRGDNVEKIKGTGLGLSIVKEYSELLGIDLNVTSASNEGTLFSLAIPYKYQNRL